MRDRPTVAIVDYGLGNLFSIRQACLKVGLEGVITSEYKKLATANAVILPGVGAFGVAMQRLRALSMDKALVDIAESNKPMVGICLGLQLLMNESHEFGHHQGLGIIDGSVVRFEELSENEKPLKVPHIGWSQIHPSTESTPITPADPSWNNTLLRSTAAGSYLYFVHSYYVKPTNPDVILAKTRYGAVEFCSALKYGKVFACQFHPECSGRAGLAVYRNLAEDLL